MDTWMYLMQGFSIALDPYNILIALIGCFIGTIVRYASRTWTH